MSKQRKIDYSLIFYFSIIFVIVQIIGLFVAHYYISENLVSGIVTSDPNSISNVLFMVTYIIFFSALLIVFKKYINKSNLLYLFEFLALFFSISIVVGTFLPVLISHIVAIYFLVIKKIVSKYDKISLYYNNFLLAIALAGAGAVLGLSFGIIPVILFITLLSIYDIVAVFYTKHMITLANMFIKKKVSFLFQIPTKNKVYKLGGGDIVIPLLVSSSLYNILITKYSLVVTLIPIIAIWICSIVGLIWTFWILSKGKIKAMPALPPQVFLMLIVLFSVYFYLL